MAFTLYLKGGNVATIEAKFIHLGDKLVVFHSDPAYITEIPPKGKYIAYFQTLEIQGIIYPTNNASVTASSGDKQV